MPRNGCNQATHDSHLPLQKWFMATLLLCEARKGMSANQIKRTLGVSYKTAWYLCHRIRAAMKETERPMMTGTVEVDETYVGGRPPRGSKPGRGTPKEVVIGIRQRGGDLRFFHASDVQSGTLAKYIRENVSQDVEVMMTDEFTSYPGAMKQTGLSEKHKTIRHKAVVYAIGDIHTNTIVYYTHSLTWSDDFRTDQALNFLGAVTRGGNLHSCRKTPSDPVFVVAGTSDSSQWPTGLRC